MQLPSLLILTPLTSSVLTGRLTDFVLVIAAAAAVDTQLFLSYRVFQKTDTQFYFWDNFGNSAPILTILSLLQAEIYGA